MNFLRVAGPILDCCATYGAYGMPDDSSMRIPVYAERYRTKFISDIQEFEIMAYREKRSVAILTANSNQKECIRILTEELGWESSDWFGREKNSDYETKVKLLWKCITGEVYKEI